LVTGILLIPTPLRVQGTLSLTPAKPTEIFVEVPGRLVSLNVKDGDYVDEKTVLATLSNPEKQLEYEQLLQQHDSSYIKSLWYNTTPKTREQYKESLNLEQKLEQAVSKISDQLDKLTIVAPRSGQLEAHLILDQTDIDLIRSKNPNDKPTAWVKIYGTSEKTHKSYVSEVALRNRDEIPAELSNVAGGEIATKQDEKTGQVKPLTAVFEVIIPIDNADLMLQPGLRGFAKIDAGHSTLAWWLWRMAVKTFHFTL
jgi:putative peptide zinc metalloprotease protein